MAILNSQPPARGGPRRPVEKRRSKYGNESTWVHGIRFDSKREAEFFRRLEILRAMGTIRFFLRQVPFELEGGVTYRADFLVFWSDPCARETIFDVKGFRTEVYRLKKKQVEARYGVTIREV